MAELMNMTHSIVKGYAALAAGQPLVPFTYEAPQLGDLEIRVNVTHSGLCYTDIHAIDDVTKNGVWMPYDGFAKSVTVDSRFAYQLPDAMPAEDASVLLCSGITDYNSLRRCRTSDVQRIGIICTKDDCHEYE